jgi:hypothetical protein
MDNNKMNELQQELEAILAKYDSAINTLKECEADTNKIIDNLESDKLDNN